MKNIFFVFMLITLLACSKTKTEHSNKSIFILEQTNKTSGVQVRFNETKDTIVYLYLENIVGALPDSLHKYPILNASIHNSYIDFDSAFLNVYGLFIVDSGFSDDIIFDSRFKNLYHLQVLNPYSKIQNKGLNLFRLEYMNEKNRNVFLLDLEVIEGIEHLEIFTSTDTPRIPLNKNYKSIGVCESNKQIQELKNKYHNVTTLSCNF